VYRVAVDGDSPYADAVEAEPSLTAVPLGSAALGDTADLVVFDGRQSGSIETVAVRASDTRKGEAAAAEFREAVKAHNERLMAAEENRTGPRVPDHRHAPVHRPDQRARRRLDARRGRLRE